MIDVSVLILQNSRFSSYLDAVGISDVCLGSSRVMSAVKTKNIKRLGRDPWGTPVVMQSRHWYKS